MNKKKKPRVPKACRKCMEYVCGLCKGRVEGKVCHLEYHSVCLMK